MTDAHSKHRPRRAGTPDAGRCTAAIQQSDWPGRVGSGQSCGNDKRAELTCSGWFHITKVIEATPHEELSLGSLGHIIRPRDGLFSIWSKKRVLIWDGEQVLLNYSLERKRI